MSKYTTELRYICESYAGLDESVGSNDVDATISTARSQIFNFSYPFFTDDPTVVQEHPELTGYKEALECKIISHYYLREIASETVGIFKLWLKNKMREIMPYYNQLYLSTLLDYDPLTDTNIKTDSATATDGTNYTEHQTSAETLSDNTIKRADSSSTDSSSKSESSDTSSSSSEGGNHTATSGNTVSKFLDTPQSQVSSIDNGYLTNIRKDTTDSDTSGTSTDSSTAISKGEISASDASSTASEAIENGVNSTTSTSGDVSDNRYASDVDNRSHSYGKGGGSDYADLVKKYRDTFLNIDLMIINDLEELFFQLW